MMNNHKKNYFGIAPILTINLKLADGIFVFADTRYRVGHVNLHQIESTEPDNELYPKKSYWSGIFEPFNAVGLRFRFD